MSNSCLSVLNLIYVGLPLEARRLTGGEIGTGVLFTLFSLLLVFGQVRVTALAKARWRAPTAMVAGMTVMGLAFAPLFVASALLPVSLPLPPAVVTAINLSPVLLSTCLLALGFMISQPFAMDLVPSLGGERRVGTYYGIFYLAAGLAAIAGNAASGAAYDAALATGVIGLPWMLMLVIAAVSVGVLLRLDRRGRLPEDTL